MLNAAKPAFARIFGKVYGLLTPYKNFNIYKKRLIDTAFLKLGLELHSFADLGGVWNVDGSYAFYIMDHYDIEHAYLIDTNMNEAVNAKAGHYGNLNVISANFGDQELCKSLKRVDAVLMFDVLLHQVKPDWDEVLKLYSAITDTFIIFNQQYTKGAHTVRLLDLGKEEYFKNVPATPDHPPYNELFDKLYEIHPQHGRIWRDIHNVWQWGITDADLDATMQNLGYALKYSANCGRFASLKNFENHAFVYSRK